MYRQIPTPRRSIPATTKRSVIGLQVKLIEAIGPTALTSIERGEIHIGIGLFQSVQADDRHHESTAQQATQMTFQNTSSRA
jgi:hypothetical protein